MELSLRDLTRLFFDYSMYRYSIPYISVIDVRDIQERILNHPDYVDDEELTWRDREKNKLTRQTRDASSRDYLAYE